MVGFRQHGPMDRLEPNRIWETVTHARSKVDRQRMKLAGIAADAPQRAYEERVLATMIENATIAAVADALGGPLNPASCAGAV